MLGCFKLKRSIPLSHFNSRKYSNILNETPRKNWKVGDVTKWAKNFVDSEDAIKVLEEQEIDGDSLLRISQEDLVNAGMKLGPASKIIAALKPDISLDLSTRNLDSFTIDHVDEDDHVTGLKVFHLRALINPKDSSSDKLFIREFFSRYLETVRKHEYSIVIGNPGIGKTWFQYYYLVRILNVDKLGPLPPDSYGSTAPPQYVIRQVGPDQLEIYDVQAKTVTTRLCPTISDIRKILNSFVAETTLYFFEPDFTKHEPISTNIPTMITVSPDIVRYKEFLKQKGAARLYMPVWREDELFAVGKNLSPTLPEEELKERIREFGGIFRYVFGSEVVQREARSNRKQAILEVDLKYLLAASTIEDLRVSHFIAQFSNIPTRVTEKSEAFTTFNIDLVSEEVEKELQDKMKDLSIYDKIVTLMKNDQSPGYFSKLCRDIYEEVIAERLVQGVIWQQRGNRSQEYSEFKLQLTLSTTVPLFSTMENGTLYRPLKENYLLADFIYKQNEKLVAIQVSREVGGKRSIHKSTFIKFLDLLKSENIKEEDFTYYYCPSPQFADSAAVTISYPKEWKIEEELMDDTTNSMKKVSRKMTEKEIEVEKIRCKKVSLNIIKIPEDYGKQLKEPNILKVSGTSPSNPNSE
jgi:hypothetical protein